MPSLDAADDPLVTILRSAFAPQLESGEVDVLASRGAREVEVQADDWTLHLEGWPVTMAFIALDEDPASLTEQRNALDAALDNQHMAALRTANRELDNAIAAALEDSGDELSAVLAAALNDHPDDLLDSMGE